MADANLTRLIELYRRVQHEQRASRENALRAAKRVTLWALLAVSLLFLHLLSTLREAILS